MNQYMLLAALFIGVGTLAGAADAAQLVSAASGSCMNLPEHGGSAPDGTKVRLFQCHDTSNQVWTVSNGQINSSFGGCLDIQGSVPTDGAQVIIVACNGRPSQKWSRHDALDHCPLFRFPKPAVVGAITALRVIGTIPAIRATLAAAA